MDLSVIVFLRGTLSFFVLLTLTRLMGKRQVSQLTFFDYVCGITIGSIAAAVAVDLSLESIPALVGLVTWAFWVIILSIISFYSRKLRKIVDGEPTIVIHNGKILESNLRQLSYNMGDLRMQLRQQGIFSLSNVEFAILEPNGQLSVQRKSQLQPVTPKDLNIATPYMGISVELISDGKLIEENLALLDLTRDWLIDHLKKRGLALNDVYYAEIDTNGDVYIDVWDDLEGQKVIDISE